MAIQDLKPNGWFRVLAVVIPLIVAGLIAWGSLRSDVRYLSREVERKADRDVVQVQYERLLAELAAIREQLDALTRTRADGGR